MFDAARLLDAPRWPISAAGCQVALVAIISFGAGCCNSSRSNEPAPANTPAPVSAETLNAINEEVERLAPQGASFQQSDLIAWLSARSDVHGVRGSPDGSVWGHFEGGTRFGILNPPYGNSEASSPDVLLSSASELQDAAMTTVPSSPSGGSHATPSGNLVASAPRMSAADVVTTASPRSALPNKAQFRCLNGIGDLFPDACPQLKRLAEAKGYQIAPDSTATIEALRAVSGDGIFVLDAHGGYDRRPNAPNKQYGMSTQTLLGKDHLSTMNKYFRRDSNGNVDYADSRFVILHAPDHREFDVSTFGWRPVREWSIGITAAFVKQEMSLGPNALVLLESCNVGTDGADIAQALIEKGATVAGWTGLNVVPILGSTYEKYTAHVTERFLLDRLLGTNDSTLRPEKPPQRPFDWNSVWNDMASRGLTTWAGGVVGSQEYPSSEFVIIPPAPTGGFAVAAPSLESIRQEPALSGSPAMFVLQGIFGDEAGDVTVGGVPAEVSKWGANEIKIRIPASGAGSNGDVVVSSLKRKSNPVQLTSWNVRFRYREDDRLLDTRHLAAEYNLHFRGDVHLFRTAPHIAPEGSIADLPVPLMWLNPESDSTGRWEVGGSYTDSDGCITTREGSGVLQPSELYADTSGYSFPMIIAFDPHSNTFAIEGSQKKWALQRGTSSEGLPNTPGIVHGRPRDGESFVRPWIGRMRANFS